MRFRYKIGGSSKGSSGALSTRTIKCCSKQPEPCPFTIRLWRDADSGRWRITTIRLEHAGHELNDRPRPMKITHAVRQEIRRLQKADVSMPDVGIALLAELPEGTGAKQLHNLARVQGPQLFRDADASRMIELLKERQNNDTTFFYDFQVDEMGRLARVAWMNGSQRRNALDFGDVVTFDTTYKTNAFNMSLGLFVGINNFNRLCLLMVGLIGDERIDSFKWLFQTYNKAIGTEKALSCLFTDGDHSIIAAAASCLPTVDHRLCHFHLKLNIFRNLSSQLREKTSLFYFEFRSIALEIQSVEAFEERWTVLREKHGNLEYFDVLDSLKSKFAAAYLQSKFTAGVSTTQSVESMNARIKHRGLSTSTSLIDVVRRIDAILNSEDVQMVKDRSTFLRQSKQTASTTAYFVKASQLLSPNAFKVFSRSIDSGLKDFTGEIIAQSNDSECQTIDVKVASKETKRAHIVSLIIKDKILMSFSCPCQLFVRSGHLCCHLFRAVDIALVDDFDGSLYCWRWKADYTRPTYTFLHGNNDEEFWREEEPTSFDRSDESRLTEKERYAILKGSADQLYSDFLALCRSSATSFEVFQKTMDKFAKIRNLMQTSTASIANPNVGRRKGRPSNRRIKSVFEASLRRRGNQGRGRWERPATNDVSIPMNAIADKGIPTNIDGEC